MSVEKAAEERRAKDQCEKDCSTGDEGADLDKTIVETRKRVTRKSMLHKLRPQSKDYETDEDATNLTGETTVSMKVAELREQLKRLNLPTQGKKNDLRRRLEEYLKEGNADDSKAENDETEVTEEETDEEIDCGRGYTRTNRRVPTGRENRRSVHSMSDARVPGATMFSIRDVEDSITTFSGDDKLSIRKWISDCEDVATLLEWNDLQKFIYAKRMLRGSAKKFFMYERDVTSWSVLKQRLRREFEIKISNTLIHAELAKRKRRPGESGRQYVYAMQEIASEGLLEEEDLMQHIINGIEDDEGRKTILYSASTLHELKQKFVIYDRIREKADKSKPKYTEERSTGMKKPQPRRNVTGKRNCFTCGSQEHLIAECSMKRKGIKCFQCNEYGHLASQCTAKAAKSKDACGASTFTKAKHCKDVHVMNHKLVALIDTGSDLSLMRAEQYIKIGSPRLNNKYVNFSGIGSDNNSTLGEFCTQVTIDGESYPIKIHVISDTMMRHDLLIGTDFLDGVDLNIKNREVSISKVEEIANSLVVPEVFHINFNNNEMDLSQITNIEHKEAIVDLVENYIPNKIRDVAVKMRLTVKDDTPVYQRARRLSPQDKSEVDSHVQTWLEDGIIRPSNSEYASPVVLVKKKSGATRLCVDYRLLNKKILKDRYPLPLIEDQIDLLQGAKLFSTIDLRNGFFHVEIEENSRKYTAFIVPNGHYEFCRVPFGLCNSPSVFQKFINAVFKDFIADGSILTYMDDIVIPSLDCQSGLKKLKTVLDRASEFGLLINWGKCKFLQSRIEYLGHVIENGSIQPSTSKTNAVMKFKKPSNARDVQSLLGLTGYFRKFIPRYSLIARPLTNLLKADVVFKFGNEEEQAFETLKIALSSRPVLKIYRFGAETELHTDASKFGYGSILLQKDYGDNAYHPVYYASGKTTPAEENYSSYELEVLAIVKSLKKFRVYLLGIQFKIVTDCRAFTLTMSKKDLCVRVARWALLLEEFQYVIEHRPGKSMAHVDALSRSPLPISVLVEKCESGLMANLKKAQNQEVELREIINAASRNEAPGYIL